MKPTTALTIDSVRTRVQRPNLGVFSRHVVAYGLAASLLGLVGTLIASLAYYHWGWVLVLIAAGASAAMFASWVAASLLMLTQSAAGKIPRMLRGWIGAQVLAAVAGLLVLEHGWLAIATAVLGLALVPVLSRISKSVEQSRLSSLGLPPQLLEPIQKLPALMPAEVNLVLDNTLRDWAHLRDLLAFANDSALRAYVDVRALSADALTTLQYIVQRAPLVAKLIEIANDRREPQARQVADAALRRLKAVSDAMHDSVAAASQYAASEQQEAAVALKARVEGLRMLAESLDVVQVEIESDAATSRRYGA